ncbi:MAG: NosD domain-containing protein [Candidatus Latescibacterota bacterium]
MRKPRFLPKRSSMDVPAIWVGVVLGTTALAFVLLSAWADAATWVVAPETMGGEDGNADAQSSPWRTIGYAVSMAVPGDTIRVRDDDSESTDDYTENIAVNKRLIIERFDHMGANPQIAASDTNSSVFHVTADSVTIRGLDMYGATGDNAAGIYLDQTGGCTLQDNRCGWDSGHGNSYGMVLDSSSANVVTGNTCSANSAQGIYLSPSSNNNTLSDNICSNNTRGILLSSSSNNAVSGNTCGKNGAEGIKLYASGDNTLSGNKYGVYMWSSSNNNTIYLNDFINNSTASVYSNSSTNIWRSPTKLGYTYGGTTQAHKSYMGNYYDDYGGSDGDGDRIGETPHATDGDGDGYPLVQITEDYYLGLWYLANPVMYEEEMSLPGATVDIVDGASVIWWADQPAEVGMSFGAGNPSDSTSWTGQVTLASPPATGDGFALEVGRADDGNGTNFWVDGPEAMITGDGFSTTVTYATDAVPLDLGQGKVVALRITNNSGSDIGVRVGGSWSYVSAPASGVGQSPAAPTGLTAVAYVDSVRLDWDVFPDPDLHACYIYRDTTSAPTVLLDSLLAPGATEPFYVDREVTVGTTYYYRITGVNGVGEESGYSDEVSATPWLYGDVSGDGTVDPFDAALILMQRVGLILLPDTTFPAFTETVADVSGVSGITAYDAALVLQYTVDLITAFPVEGGGAKWVASFPRTVWLGETEDLGDGTFLIPILIDEMSGVIAVRIEAIYDASTFEFIELRNGDRAKNYMSYSNLYTHDFEDWIEMVCAGTRAPEGGGRVAEVILRPRSPENKETPEIALRDVQLNEGRVPVSWFVSVDAEFRSPEVPSGCRLGQNTPNPFNAGTTLTFDLPSKESVHLAIYTLTGQQIRTLVDAERKAGRNAVRWDGRDERGHSVASGIYLYRIQCGEFVSVKRMVLLQ